MAYFGAVNLLVIFVCLGIAVDDVFVVVNAFKSTRDLFDGKGEGESMTEDEKLMYRLGTSYRKSASAVFLTSFTTAAAVLTNMLSPLKGVRTFVLFMVWRLHCSGSVHTTLTGIMVHPAGHHCHGDVRPDHLRVPVGGGHLGP